MLKNIQLDRPLAVLDLETTGIDPKLDRIVEVSVLKLSPVSPCLGWPDVTPCGATTDFSISHYITVSSPSGGVGGRWAMRFNAFRTNRASGHPPATP